MSYSSHFRSTPVTDELGRDRNLYTFRVKRNNFVTVDTHDAPGIRNYFYRLIARLLKV